MAESVSERSLRSEYVPLEFQDRSRYARLARPLPHLGDTRGLTADLAPPVGKALSARKKTKKAPRQRSIGAVRTGIVSKVRAIQSITAIFSWFSI